jgi:hypothetical protein
MNRFCVILVALLLSPPVLAIPGTGQDLFTSTNAALKFTASIGPGWQKFSEQLEGFETGDGLKVTIYTFPQDHLKGVAAIGVDAAGNLKLYEIRFPIRNGGCQGTPDTKKLARMLLDHTEPDSLSDFRHVNQLSSRADWVWPHQMLNMPPAKIGRTSFLFLKRFGYCAVQVRRLTS